MFSDMRIRRDTLKVLIGIMPFSTKRRCLRAQEQRKTAGVLLFFGSPGRARSRISAEDEVPLADNSWEEQRKTATSKPNHGSSNRRWVGPGFRRDSGSLAYGFLCGGSAVRPV
jgi:hypothetical protein